MTREQVLLCALRRIYEHPADISGGPYMVKIAGDALCVLGELEPAKRDQKLANLGLLPVKAARQ